MLENLKDSSMEVSMDVCLLMELFVTFTSLRFFAGKYVIHIQY